MTLSELEVGQTAKIKGFSDHEMSLRLLEMGCLPGEQVEVCNISPLGDPIAIHVSGYKLSLRRKEASTIQVYNS